MDAVVTYVNGSDPQWLEDYRRVADEPLNAKRFRDWGTLRYLLRGIETHMPFVRNVYLVVARPSQVPAWADTSRLKVVLHSDIVPEGLLPLFNGASIEMFLHRIEGLDEEFIYLNDDFFPVRDCRSDYFFRESRSAVAFHRCLLASNMYKYHCKISDDLARQLAHKRPRLTYMRPQHTCLPLLRSVCEEMYGSCEEEILSKVSPLRRMENYNHYLFADYAYYTGRTFRRKVSNRHFSTAVAPIGRVCRFLLHPDRDFVCINDVNMPQERFAAYRDAVVAAFERALPAPSRFEL